mgnify:FL=1
MAIKPLYFFNFLKKKKIKFFTGVPDSLLKELCLCIDQKTSEENHIITANEGNAIAIASGSFLASNSIPLVYMQNSGLGNAVNPLLSLCDSQVYSIPMLLLIGWRGEPGVKDEPQHIKQGRIQTDLLNTLGIPYIILSKNEKNFKSKVSDILKIAKNESKPVAILVKKNTFEKFDSKPVLESDGLELSREEALEIILNQIDNKSIIVSTTGKTSREIFEIRKKNNQLHYQDFLTVGSMGHCTSIGLGIALEKKNRKVFVIDGDGALLMHMGSLTNVVSIKPKNFFHILINNKVHESVGGQSTAAKNIDLSNVIKGIGYPHQFLALSRTQLKKNICRLINSVGPSFLEVIVRPGSRNDLGRPSIKPAKNKLDFMKFLDE